MQDLKKAQSPSDAKQPIAVAVFDFDGTVTIMDGGALFAKFSGKPRESAQLAFIEAENQTLPGTNITAKDLIIPEAIQTIQKAMALGIKVVITSHNFESVIRKLLLLGGMTPKELEQIDIKGREQLLSSDGFQLHETRATIVLDYMKEYGNVPGAYFQDSPSGEPNREDKEDYEGIALHMAKPGAFQWQEGGIHRDAVLNLAKLAAKKAPDPAAMAAVASPASQSSAASPAAPASSPASPPTINFDIDQPETDNAKFIRFHDYCDYSRCITLKEKEFKTKPKDGKSSTYKIAFYHVNLGEQQIAQQWLDFFKNKKFLSIPKDASVDGTSIDLTKNQLDALKRKAGIIELDEKSLLPDFPAHLSEIEQLRHFWEHYKDCSLADSDRLHRFLSKDGKVAQLWFGLLKKHLNLPKDLAGTRTIEYEDSTPYHRFSLTPKQFLDIPMAISNLFTEAFHNPQPPSAPPKKAPDPAAAAADQKKVPVSPASQAPAAALFKKVKDDKVLGSSTEKQHDDKSLKKYFDKLGVKNATITKKQDGDYRITLANSNDAINLSEKITELSPVDVAFSITKEEGWFSSKYHIELSKEQMKVVSGIAAAEISVEKPVSVAPVVGIGFSLNGGDSNS